MDRMIALAVTGVLSAGVVGCATNEMETRREVAQAVLSRYPGNSRAPETFRLAAADNPGNGTVELLNLSDTAVPAGKVWVNGRFVGSVPVIEPRTTVVVNYSDLLEAGPNVMDLKRAESQVVKVEYETAQGLFAVDGPSRR